MRILLLLYLVASLISSGCGKREEKFHLKKILFSRPPRGRHLLDYAHLLTYEGEDKEETLKFLRKQYGIEAFVVTIPSLEGKDIGLVASQMFNNRNIGRDVNGRGVLLLLSGQEKLIKMEVGYGLETVFTDLFCGYIERKQLKRYLENNQVDEGLSAVLEEFIARVEGRLTDHEIKKKMEGYLSGGAGIKKQVHIGNFTQRQELSEATKKNFSAQSSPERLFEKYRQVMAKCINDVNLGIYTEASRIAMRYMPKFSPSMCRELSRAYAKPHQVITKGNYAVVLFPNDKKHGPIFMKRTNEGWQIDMISIPKWIRYDGNNDWFIGGDSHPYMFAFRNEAYSDYVWDYDFYDDFGKFSKVSANYDYYIQRYEENLRNQPTDFESLISLAEIFFDLAVTNKAIPLLEKAIKIKPDDPRPYRYLGLLYRDALCAEETALRYLRKYTELAPTDPNGYHYLAITCWRIASWKDQSRYYDLAAKYMLRYGQISGDLIYAYNWIGYIYYYYKGDRRKGKIWFEKVLRLDPNNAYAKSALEAMARQ